MQATRRECAGSAEAQESFCKEAETLRATRRESAGSAEEEGEKCVPHSDVVLDMLPDVDEALPTLLAEEAPVDTCDKEEAASPIAAAMAKASLSVSCVTSGYHLRDSLSLGRAIICCVTCVRNF